MASLPQQQVSKCRNMRPNETLSFQVKEGMFDKEKFDDLCWMMTMKKNFKGLPQGALLSQRDCFKLFCLFNLLSEDRYPLVMIPEEVKYVNLPP